MQNIPEGIIVTVAMRGVGVSPAKAFLISAMTGVIEIFGSLIGYFAVGISAALLPLVLALAGGTMLYVISEEMIPESHSSEGRGSTYFLLFGFSFMLILNALLKN
jgi:ZIP family zinc transporter